MARSKRLSWEGGNRVSLPGTDSLWIRDCLHLCRDVQIGMIRASSPGSPHLLAMRVWQVLQAQSFSCFFYNTEMLRNIPPRWLWGWCDCTVGTVPGTQQAPSKLFGGAIYCMILLIWSSRAHRMTLQWSMSEEWLLMGRQWLNRSTRELTGTRNLDLMVAARVFAHVKAHWALSLELYCMCGITQQKGKKIAIPPFSWEGIPNF